MSVANPNFMNGVPDLLILRLLAEKEMYGYELVQAITARTGAAISLGEGVVYPALHALEREGALKSRRRLVNGRTRVYYAATAKGKKKLSGLTLQWNRIAEAIARTMGETRHATAPL